MAEPSSTGEKTAEITLPEARLRKVLETLENHESASLIPALSGKKTLLATATGTRQWEALQQKGAKTIVDFDINPLFGYAAPQPKPSGVHLVKGSLASAPFQDESFEFLLLFGATTRTENVASWISEATRLLKDGSRVVISFLHPYLEHQMNPRLGFPHGIDKYYMDLRRAGIYVEEIKEAKADESVRSIFGPAKDDKDFAQIKGTPMVLFFKAIRLKKR
ncbi:MAG: methyltransferase domain-containing protein [bacterium]